jgi:hypothetical protein
MFHLIALPFKIVFGVLLGILLLPFLLLKFVFKMVLALLVLPLVLVAVAFAGMAAFALIVVTIALCLWGLVGVGTSAAVV